MSWNPTQVFGDANENNRSTLEVRDDEDGEITITIEMPVDAASMCLDKDRARELFNWLGVWLHRS